MENEYPTADNVAVAIVTAARACNEDPLAICSGITNLHSRHYAAHALARVFERVPHHAISRMVGSATPNAFFRQSQSFLRRKARGFAWWSPKVFEAVVSAIDAHRRIVKSTEEGLQPAPQVEPVIPAAPRPQASAGTNTVPKREVTEHRETGQSPLRHSNFGAATAPTSTPTSGDKRKLYDMLAAAVANTPGAKQVSKGENENV